MNHNEIQEINNQEPFLTQEEIDFLKGYGFIYHPEELGVCEAPYLEKEYKPGKFVFIYQDQIMDLLAELEMLEIMYFVINEEGD